MIALSNAIAKEVPVVALHSDVSIVLVIDGK